MLVKQINDRILCLSLHYLNKLFKKKKIYHNMQHDMLYNFYKTTFFFIDALFAFKMDGVLSYRISDMKQ
jgi:hypothetical protein